jgi:DNA-binding GntR family transcriptional regulator
MTGESKTRADRIYQELRADILSGRLSPGQRLPFAELCGRYDVSIGVLREVLPRLTEQGLVSAEPQIGFRVMSVSEDDLLQLTEARVAIETLVLRQSIEHGDLSWESALLAAHHTLAHTPVHTAGGEVNHGFLEAHANYHETLLAASPNRRLFAIANRLRDTAELYRVWAHSRPQAKGRDFAREHQRILDATLARDTDRAVGELSGHIEKTSQILLAGRRTAEGGHQARPSRKRVPKRS